MNSFIIARLQRKLTKFSENPFSGSRVSGPTFRVPGFGSHLCDGFRVSDPTYEMGPKSRVSGPTNSPGSRTPPFGYVEKNKVN